MIDAYCTARRISPAEATGMPSSEKATAPVSASSPISVSSSPRWPRVIAARKPTGTSASVRAASIRAPRVAEESTTGSVFGIARIAQ